MAYTRDNIAFAAGSETSYLAALQARKFVARQGVVVYRWLRKRGQHGGTQVECAAHLGISRPSLCARFRGLEQAGAIAKTAVKRAGCFAYVVTGPMPAQLSLL